MHMVDRAIDFLSPAFSFSNLTDQFEWKITHFDGTWPSQITFLCWTGELKRSWVELMSKALLATEPVANSSRKANGRFAQH